MGHSAVRLLDMSNTTRRDDVTDFGRDARDLPASDDARRSGECVAGCLETPAVILDWHYAASPFATELLASRRAEHGESEAEFPEWLCSPRPAQVAAVNDNKRLWVVR
jgi:hypothetical protein